MYAQQQPHVQPVPPQKPLFKGAVPGVHLGAREAPGKFLVPPAAGGMSQDTWDVPSQLGLPTKSDTPRDNLTTKDQMPLQTVPSFSPYIQPVFASLKDPFQSPYCHMTYVRVIVEFYPHMNRAKESTNPILQDIAKSLLMFYARPVDDTTRHVELDTRLFRNPCRCVSMFPQLYDVHGRRDASSTVVIRTGKQPVRNLDELVILLSEITDLLISTTQVSDNGNVRAWQRQMSHLVADHFKNLTDSFSHWLARSDGAQVFALLGTLFDLCFKMQKQVEMSGSLRSAFLSRMHKLVNAEHAEKEARSPRIDLMFHGAGCFAIGALTIFNCHAMSASQAARFCASFSPGAEGVYEDVYRLLPMKSRGGNALKTGAVQDVWALGTFGSHLHSLLGPSRLPMAPVITEAMKKEVGEPPKGWVLFHAYFRNADRCSNHLRHSTLGDNSSTRDTGFLFTAPHRVERGARLPACTGCQASHYCSKECQRESWKDKQMPHRDFCPILKIIFQTGWFLLPAEYHTTNCRRFRPSWCPRHLETDLRRDAWAFGLENYLQKLMSEPRTSKMQGRHKLPWNTGRPDPDWIGKTAKHWQTRVTV
ncbi:hypothetical protein B0H11DRAFT_1902960 [Mycena galericulata]|nr:hypothetical protein B0H11DRAFT_1902960 [Mycena galericulata]